MNENNKSVDSQSHQSIIELSKTTSEKDIQMITRYQEHKNTYRNTYHRSHGPLL